MNTTKSSPKKTCHLSLFLIFYLLLSSCFLGNILAEESEKEKDASPYVMETITVTAPGSSTTIKDVDATVQVITLKDIDTTSKRNLAQIIEQATGFFVSNTGSTSSASLRGFSSGQTLILVDGMRRTGKYGSLDLNRIPMETIEKIEIVRGPMSALYGADAMAGVINIVTRAPASQNSFSATTIAGVAENGDRGTGMLRMYGSMAPSDSKMKHSISAEVKRRGDYKKEESQLYTDLNEEKGYSFSYNGTYNIDDRQYFSMTADFFKQDDEGINSSSSLGYPDTFEDEENFQFNGKYHYDLSEGNFDLTAGYGTASAKVDRTGGTETTDYDQYELNGFFTYTGVKSHSLTVGAGGRRQKIDMTTISTSPTRNVYHALAQDCWQINSLFSITGGVRYDHYNDFGNTTNPKLSLTFQPNDFKFRLGYGTAFRAPTFIEQYGYFERASGSSISKIYGNNDIDPEKSRTVEVGAGYFTDRFNLELVYHISKVKDLISTTRTGMSGSPATGYTVIYEYDNISEADISGVETTFGMRLNKYIDGSASWSYLDKKDSDTEERLTGYARNTYKAAVNLTLDAFSFHTTFRYFKDYYNTDYTLSRTADPVDSNFHCFDIKAQFNFLKYHTISAGVDNLFNEETPNNFTRGSVPGDPGERYYYVEYTFDF